MHALDRNSRTAAALAGAIFTTFLLSACGRTAKPSPIDAALNAPEGSTEKAPAKPSELKPPALPPNPGHIGRN